jgi:hypothetical protein
MMMRKRKRKMRCMRTTSDGLPEASCTVYSVQSSGYGRRKVVVGSSSLR